MSEQPQQPEVESALWLRVQRTRRIVEMRSRRDPETGALKAVGWVKIAKDLGISRATAFRYFDDHLRWQGGSDAMATVEDAVALREQMMVELSELWVECKHTHPSAAVGAVRAMLEVDRERIELLQAAGRVPRNLARWRAEADFAQIAREMMEVLERRGVGAEVLEELHNVVRRHVPEHADNVRPIEVARSRRDG